MFSPLCPRPPSQLSISKHLSSSRCTMLIALGAEPGAPTLQLPTQKSSCRLSAPAAKAASSAANAAGFANQSDAPTATKPTIFQPDPFRLCLMICFMLDDSSKYLMAQGTCFDIIYLLCDSCSSGRMPLNGASR